MSETAKPRVYGFCDAGCRRETVLREDFLRSASLFEIYPDSGGKWYLEKKKQYKIFAPKDENGAFSFELYVDYIIGKHYITTSTNDEYADWFVFRFLDYKHIGGTQYKIVYEIEGNRYTEIIADGDADIDGIVLSGATQVFLYNDDATVYARDGADGKDFELGTYYTVKIPCSTSADMYGWAFNQVDGYGYMAFKAVNGITDDSMVFPSCDDNTVFTDNRLTISRGTNGDAKGLWFDIETLPDTEKTLYIMIAKANYGGEL